MPHNVEIKARATDLEFQTGLAARLAHGPARYLIQEDTIFKVPSGRLKLRSFADGTGELIQYNRDDSVGPKESLYLVAQAVHPSLLKQLLTNALGVSAVVRKKRTVYINGRTRMHFDEVSGLGSFIELEVVLAPGEDPAGGAAEADELMSKLGIRKQDLVAGAYVDLFAQVRNVHKRAFNTEAEANLVDMLRDANKSPIARVALHSGTVVGHVVFSPVTISNATEDYRMLGLGPVAVLPEYQGQGIGSAIIREGLEQCKKDGYDAVVLLGYPNYYSRFGFRRARDHGIDNEYGADEEFMALALKENALNHVSGLVRYAPEFQMVS